ncbi:MAG: succinyl-diaminopimelate desuccinylase [Gammaproteobacteria bacterium]|nr:succinyl-diaminopimelate desuccinylase [Gammaproteobacteria bacterium]
MNSPTLILACELIKRPSVTPDDQGCLELLGTRLAASGFQIELLPFGAVSNLWAVHGSGAPVFCFAGHTDVVPPGDLANWQSPPFEPTIRDGVLYGRGAADMKGSVAAMVTAAERFVATHPAHGGTLAFLLTSDEEGVAVDGTRRVVDTLAARQQPITWCLVGEPSSQRRLGDLLRNGRRGSLNGRLRVHGVQGHIAYPTLASNPIHLALPALTEICANEWDAGNEFFPPTSFQISNLNAGTGAENVIPPRLDAWINFRFGTASTVTGLQARVTSVLERHRLDYTLEWHLSGEPFLTPRGALVDAVVTAIREENGVSAALSTGGGTSDGRFIAKLGSEIIELGPVNATIHKINECVRVAELDELSTIYQSVLNRLLLDV